MEIKGKRDPIVVDDFIGENVDSRTFNEIFEYNKKKYTGDSIVESGVDYSFGGPTLGLPFQPIIQDSSEDILPINEEYRPLFNNDINYQYEKKLYTPEFNFKDTKQKEKEIKRNRKEKLVLNSQTNADIENKKLEQMRKELSDNDKVSKKIKHFLRIN